MGVQQINIKYCSLFPSIDFSQNSGFCTFVPKLVNTEISQIKVTGAYKRLNKKGQTGGHTIQTHIKKQKVLYIYHEESVATSLFILTDDVTITDEFKKAEIYTDCIIETELLSNNKYKTTVTGFVLGEYNESCNISSDFVKNKNQYDINNLVNRVEVIVTKPSYTGVSDFTDGGTNAEFTLGVDEITSNININDYLYFHSNFDFEAMGLSAVKCINKTATILTFEGADSYTTFTSEINQNFTLNFDPAYFANGNVVSSPVTTSIYTDFIPNFKSEIEPGGKKIEVAQGKVSVTEKTVTRVLTVPIIVIDSEIWKIEQIYKADRVKFIGQNETYYAFEVDNILKAKSNTQLFGVKEYELEMPYLQEVIRRNH
ncbi:MAG: hypothetical protein IMY67_01890 [Bacteroidetes bacterium]|nr:hypothetical protein [Bacteroidota bacterium]